MLKRISNDGTPLMPPDSSHVELTCLMPRLWIIAVTKYFSKSQQLLFHPQGTLLPFTFLIFSFMCLKCLRGSVEEITLNQSHQHLANIVKRPHLPKCRYIHIPQLTYWSSGTSHDLDHLQVIAWNKTSSNCDWSVWQAVMKAECGERELDWGWISLGHVGEN